MDQQRAERLAQYEAEMVKNESKMSRRLTPEAMEAPRIVRAHQFKYGKHVVEKDGPIEQRRDYHVTAVPEDEKITAGLVAGMHMSRLPFGATDLTSWGKTSFEPIVRVSRTLEGVPYVICGKLAGRPEAGLLPDGKPKPSRTYVEGHFIAIPADQWSVAVVPQLPSVLDTTPRVVGEPDRVPPLEIRTDNLDQPLPEGWLDQLTKDLIVRISAGKSLSIQDWKMEQRDSLEHIFRAEICLPEEVGRRMSFGSGIKDANIDTLGLRVYHGMIVHPGTALRPGNPWDRDDKEKNRLGEEYLAALAPLVASAKTPRDVMKAVLQLPPDLIERVTKRVYPE